MENKLSYDSLVPHLKNMRGCGLYQLSSDATKLQRFMQMVYMRLVLLFIMLYTVQQMLKVYEVRSDAAKVMDTMFLLLTNSDCIYKQIVVWQKADKINALLDIMKGPIFNQGVPEHEKFLSRTARQARLLLRAFNYAALFNCLLWIIFPVILYMQGKPVEFAIWLFFDANASPQFYFVVVYVWIQTSWLAFNNTTMDVLISFFFAQSKTQLSILRFDLENVVAKSKEESVDLAVSFSDVLRRRFQKMLLHYDEIVSFSKTVEDIFGGAILYQFLVSGWILCTAAYRTVNMIPASLEFNAMIVYMICIMTQVYLYCSYGNDVNHESQMLINSAYAVDWLEIPLRSRRDLIIFMERIKRPISPKAKIIIPLSSSTFVSICRSSYSFYAFLKNSS